MRPARGLRLSRRVPDPPRRGMRLRGDWDGAERQAQAACDELQDFQRRSRRRLLRDRRDPPAPGQLRGAEEAYARANELGAGPAARALAAPPGAGKVDAAASGIRRARWRRPTIRSRGCAACRRRSRSRSPRRSRHRQRGRGGDGLDHRRVQDRRPPGAAFDGALHLARGRIVLRRGRRRAAVALLRARSRRVAGRRRALRDRAGAARARDRVPASGDEHARDRPRSRPRWRRSSGSARGSTRRSAATCSASVDGVDAHSSSPTSSTRRAARHARRGEVAAPARPPRRDRARADRQGRRRRDQEHRRRLLRLVRRRRCGHPHGDRDPEGARRRDRRARRADRRPQRRRVPHGQRLHRLRRREPSTWPRGSGRPPAPARSSISRESLDGVAGAFRLSEPRAEILKGFEEPVEVVAVDWR